jgi:hypothetical protein
VELTVVFVTHSASTRRCTCPTGVVGDGRRGRGASTDEVVIDEPLPARRRPSASRSAFSRLLPRRLPACSPTPAATLETRRRSHDSARSPAYRVVAPLLVGVVLLALWQGHGGGLRRCPQYLVPSAGARWRSALVERLGPALGGAPGDR